MIDISKWKTPSGTAFFVLGNQFVVSEMTNV